jgi:hypothetical protein
MHGTPTKRNKLCAVSGLAFGPESQRERNREDKPNPILKDISVMMRFEPKKNLPKTF